MSEGKARDRAWFLAHGWLGPIDAARLLGVSAERARQLGDTGAVRMARDERGYRWFERADLERRAAAMRAIRDVRARYAEVLAPSRASAGAVR